MLERVVGSRSLYAAVFDQMPAGAYTLWHDGAPRASAASPSSRVEIGDELALARAGLMFGLDDQLASLSDGSRVLVVCVDRRSCSACATRATPTTSRP